LPSFHDTGKFRIMNWPAAHQTPAAAVALVADLRYELVPMKGVDEAIAELPPGAPVSVTCSPVKGLPATLELTARLLDLGHDAVPHLSARMVEGPDHVAQVAGWFRAHGVRSIFVVAGDAATAIGPYADGISLLRALVMHETGLRHVGVPAYPAGHAFVDRSALRDALLEKQALLSEAGLRGSATTQMCFDASRVRRWLLDERANGFTLPVDLGVPGVVSRTKLLSIGLRLGVGSSLRYVRKNRATTGRMMATGGYDPTELVAALADDAAGLGIEGLHSFTFNSVASTATWQHAVVEAL
jgi:methylenetetrahydrofolate reductase (NADPH)